MIVNKTYKSSTNENVAYTPLHIERDLTYGTKILLSRKIIATKKLNLKLFKLPYKKKFVLELVYFKPKKGVLKNKWLQLKHNFYSYPKEWNKINIKHIVKSQSFHSLLDQIAK